MFNILVRNLTQTLFPTYDTSYDLLPIQQVKKHRDALVLLPYRQPVNKNAIHANKYHRDQKAAAALAEVFDLYLQKRTVTNITIIPVPQSYTRWRERGFNHLENILMYSNFSKYARNDLLTKTTHTKRQAHVDRKQRLQQQIGSFTCNAQEVKKLRGTLILFDDVITTGATIRAARSTLAPHLHPECKLVCLAVAH